MIGSTISHYRVVERLGRGAMGLVYKAQDLRLDRPVAIKLISREIASTRSSATRFEREARTASLLDHANICTIHEFGETPEGDLFIVMGFCPGENLRTRLERGPAAAEGGRQHRRAGGARDWRRRTAWASFIATSSPPTSCCCPMAR